jgi:hypothetical protein
LERIIDGELPEHLVRPLSQWRIDYPPAPDSIRWTERQMQVLSVAEKILTRGRLTLCSPTLEEQYQKFEKVVGSIVASIIGV